MKTAIQARLQSIGVVLVVLFTSVAILKFHDELPLMPLRWPAKLPLLLAVDSRSYLAMAQNGPSQILSPFSKRMLYPWLAGTLARTTGCSIRSAFLGLNLIALLALAFFLAEILRAAVGKPLLALLFLLTPFPLEGFELAYLPDLFHTALTAAFFLLLLRKETWNYALVILFLAFLTRESTLLICLIAVWLAWRRSEKRLAMGAGAVLAAGGMASSFFGRLGKPNLHHLPDFIYMIGKVPYYFLLNLFGVRVWSDLRPEQGTPFVTWRLPAGFHFTADQVIGLAYPDWHCPIHTLIVLLTVFGVGPLLVVCFWRRMGKVRDLPLAIELALVYGAISYVLGPLLGDWTERLFGYAWPVFWITLPCLMLKYGPRLPARQEVLLWACYSVSCWWPRFFDYGNNRTVNPWPSFGVLIFYLVGVLILRQVRSNDEAVAGQPAAKAN